MKWGRFGLSLLVLLQMQTVSAAPSTGVGRSSDAIDTGFFPIELSPTNGNSVDRLFLPQPIVVPPKKGEQTPPAAGGGTPNVGGPNVGTPNNPGNPATPGTPAPAPAPSPGVITTPATKEEFKCNLFANSDYADILSAVNALNTAVSSPACNGNGLTAQMVVTQTNTIKENIAKLKPILENPESLPPEKIPDVVTQVDLAVRAVNTLATTFGNSNLMRPECRQQMNGGQIALAINDMINGLTPYALMAATMTGGTAAIPFIVGGTVITGAISSLGKIVTENSTKIQDPSVRKAVVENTCQYIRLEQRYRFLLKSRDEQVRRISEEMVKARNLMSVRISGTSNTTTSLINRKNALDAISLSIENTLSSASASLDLDKQFVQSTNDDIKICTLGIQLAQMSEDPTSYVTAMLASVDQAMVAYGSNNFPQARALQTSGRLAINSLKDMAAQQLKFNSDFGPCSRATKSLVETIAQSATVSRQILKLGQINLDKELSRSPEYAQIQARLKMINQKQQQATRITKSLDNLSRYATAFNQSEIDSEMDRLRNGLFGTRTMGISSPVMAWFNYTTGLHRTSVDKFKAGFQSLKNRAYRFTKTGKNSDLTNALVTAKTTTGIQQLALDDQMASNLETLTLKYMPRGSQAYSDACREMTDVWNRWMAVVDHLSAVESYCQMINNYIYDGRSEDAALVQMCRGRQVSYGVGSNQSELGKMKATLINDKSSTKAVLVKRRLEALACPMASGF